MDRRHRLRWLPEAYEDLQAAKDWYDDQSPGLGAEFIAEFWHTVDQIDRSPMLPRIVELPDMDDTIRRWHFEASWPYSIVYLSDNDLLVFVAVTHDRRHPVHWTERLPRR